MPADRRVFAALAAIAVLAIGCGSPSAPRRCDPCAATAPGGAPAAAGATAAGPIQDAYELWIRLRTSAEKASALPAGDQNRGWLDRAIDSDGRALFSLMADPAFAPFAVTRDAVRARLLLVIKPPGAEDRHEAIQFVDQGFSEILKRAGGTPPAPAPAPAPS